MKLLKIICPANKCCLFVNVRVKTTMCSTSTKLYAGTILLLHVIDVGQVRLSFCLCSCPSLRDTSLVPSREFSGICPGGVAVQCHTVYTSTNLRYIPRQSLLKICGQTTCVNKARNEITMPALLREIASINTCTVHQKTANILEQYRSSPRFLQRDHVFHEEGLTGRGNA